MSLGDERTFGDRLDDQETVIGDIEVVDLASRYKTEGTLGRGGMGEVLLALDTRLDRKVAIKRILGEAARSKTAVSRFLTEAKAIAALNHPNVVQIYDYGRAEDGPFLIMEYVDGSSLLDRCRDGALPLEEAVNLACQLCDGLGKAHDLGIVHRDIKPANVLLTKDGLPKLTDFGLAKAEATDHQMTMTGAVLGTPDFMPPEQRKDAALVDARSDLWSLAATVYQMVTGRSPKIIRFDLLPAGLTDVLGKALEEAKEDRFQTARELRDALKASLVATAPASAELSAGQCPSCGIKNDSSRRFCRGCGESLEAPCLSCSKPMPMWEEICGQCGTKQGPLLEERRGDMAAQQAEAEGLLKDHDFERAEGIAVALRDESDSRLNQLAPWATKFLPKIAAARDAQLAQAASTLAEALKHEASFDYLSAIHALEQVPEILRGLPLGGQADTVGVVLGRVAARQAEVERLESFVKARIAAKELGGLLREVRKLLELRPDRTDVAKLCKQLEERQQKLVAQRDEALKLAQSHLDAKDYESVIAVLRKVDLAVETPEVAKLRDAANANIKRLQELMHEISRHLSRKELDGLTAKVETALSLRPEHPELLKLLESLQVRETKVSAGVHDVVSQAHEALKACRFDKAVTLLQRIPEHRRDSEIVDLLDRCDYLAMTKAGVISGLEGLPKNSDLAEVEGIDLVGLARCARSYLDQIAVHGLGDPAIAQWFIRCKAAAEKREAAAEAERVAKANLRRILIGAGAGAAIIFLVITSLAIRSFWRSASIQAAVQRGDWQAALTLDPVNVAAIVGLARSKLAEEPPDVDGALSELGRAKKLSPAAEAVAIGFAHALATRARQYAAADKLSEAEKDYNEVVSSGHLAEELAAVADAVRKARRRKFRTIAVNAISIANDGDLSRAEHLLKEAIAGEADPDALQSLRDALQHGWLKKAADDGSGKDYESVLAACRKARDFGATSEKTQGFETRAHMRKATLLVQQGKVDEGLSLAMSVCKEQPDTAQQLLNEPWAASVRELAEQFLQREIRDALLGGNMETALATTAQARICGFDWHGWISNIVEERPSLVAELPPDFMTHIPSAKVLQTILSLDKGDFPSIGTLDCIPLAELRELPERKAASLPALRNSIGMTFRFIPSAHLVFHYSVPTRPGQPYLEKSANINVPGFFICEHEVTNHQYQSVMKQPPKSRDLSGHSGADSSILPARAAEVAKDRDFPAMVAFSESEEFCKRLSQLPEETRRHRLYRLPYEEEWRRACGLEDQKIDILAFAWLLENSGKSFHRIATKKPNKYGLFDMIGNANEWVAVSRNTFPGRTTGLGKGGGGGLTYGGGFADSAKQVESLRDGPQGAASDASRLGFRMVLTVEGGR